MAYKIKKKGFYVEKKGVWASYGLEGIGKKSFDIARLNAKLKDGRQLSVFINRENNLLVVDVIDKDEKGGTEIIRKKV
jgi:hypothetical protein